MANLAYVSVWCRDFSEAAMLPLVGKLLETVPHSSSRPGFASLEVRALGPEEAPVVEHDLRAYPATAGDVVELAAAHLHADSAYETRAFWDLWIYNLELGRWTQEPQPLGITCNGEEYDGGVYRENGHFLIEAGFEHLFTGHAKMLGRNSDSSSPAQHPMETEFLMRMADPERLREYHERTRENIGKLFDWVRKAEAVLPVERYRLWSEGEENFEARLDEILALR